MSEGPVPALSFAVTFSVRGFSAEEKDPLISFANDRRSSFSQMRPMADKLVVASEALFAKKQPAWISKINKVDRRRVSHVNYLEKQLNID